MLLRTNTKIRCWVTTKKPALSFTLQDMRRHLRSFPGELAYIAKDISSLALVGWELNEPTTNWQQTFIKVGHGWCCFSTDVKGKSIATSHITVDEMLALLHKEIMDSTPEPPA